MGAYSNCGVLILILLMHCERTTCQTDQRYLLTSDTLPEDIRLVPAVGNGQVATQVFSDTIYMNGLMNGLMNNSHRARIPSTVAFNVSIDGTESTSYTLDMYKGVFFADFDHANCSVQQRFYAHRSLSRILVSELLVTRKAEKSGAISINLSPNLGDPSPDINLSTVKHSKDSSHMFGMIKEPETSWSEPRMVHVFSQNIPDKVSLKGNKRTNTWTFITAISPVEEDALFSFEEATNTPSLQLLSSHEEAWAALWEEGRIEINGNESLAQTINACFFHIMISTPDMEDRVNPFAGLSPGGLARGGWLNHNYNGGAYNDYAGHVFWDMDTWIMPPILMVHPDKVLSYLDARLRVVDVVRESANKTGYTGVRFPWEQGWTGEEVCPWEPAAEYQIHITADVSYAIRQYLYSTRNIDMLNKRGGKDMALEIARFWRSRSIDGTMYNETIREIYGVMGPDEYHLNVNNSVFTNYNAKLSMELPAYLRDELGIMFTPSEDEEINELHAMAQNMYILFDQELQYHPQFEGFDYKNDIIKQSDVVLLGYPLMLEMPPSVRENDLVIYENLTDQFGPDTGTWSMHTVGWLELGHPEKAEEMFFKMFRNIHEPFKIFSEKAPNPDQGIRAVNFITGMGGLLQSVIFGYASVRVRMHQLDLLTPYVLPYCDSWSIRGFDYNGNALDISVQKDAVVIDLIDRAEGAEPLYYIKDSNGYKVKMDVGHQVSMSPGKISFVLESELDKAKLPPSPPSTSSSTPQTSGVSVTSEILSHLIIVSLTLAYKNKV